MQQKTTTGEFAWGRCLLVGLNAWCHQRARDWCHGVCVCVRACVCARARARSCSRRSSSSRQVRSGQVRSQVRGQVASGSYCILSLLGHDHSATPIAAVRPRHTTRHATLCALTHSHRRIYAFMVDDTVPPTLRPSTLSRHTLGVEREARVRD